MSTNSAKEKQRGPSIGEILVSMHRRVKNWFFVPFEAETVEQLPCRFGSYYRFKKKKQRIGFRQLASSKYRTSLCWRNFTWFCQDQRVMASSAIRVLFIREIKSIRELKDIQPIESIIILDWKTNRKWSRSIRSHLRRDCFLSATLLTISYLKRWFRTITLVSTAIADFIKEDPGTWGPLLWWLQGYRYQVLKDRPQPAGPERVTDEEYRKFIEPLNIKLS